MTISMMTLFDREDHTVLLHHIVTLQEHFGMSGGNSIDISQVISAAHFKMSQGLITVEI